MEKLFGETSRLRMAKEYTIHESSKDTERIEGWIMQINQIKDAIAQRDIDTLHAYMSDAYTHIKESDIFYEIIERELDEEGLNLLAIGFWVLREQGNWKGNFTVGKRLLQSKGETLSNFIGKEASPSCLDTSVLIQRLASEFGVKGSVTPMAKKFVTHRFFTAESGKILDVLWGHDRAGYFENKDDWKKNNTKSTIEHICAKNSIT